MSRSRPNSSHATAQRSLLGDLKELPPVRRSGKQSPRRRQAGADAPDGFTAALKLVVEYGRLAREQLEGSAKAGCPRCGRLGPTGTNPGKRSGGATRSLCRNCQEVQARSPRNQEQEGDLFAFP